jgi:hypothetical protein
MVDIPDGEVEFEWPAFDSMAIDLADDSSCILFAPRNDRIRIIGRYDILYGSEKFPRVVLLVMAGSCGRIRYKKSWWTV